MKEKLGYSRRISSERVFLNEEFSVEIKLNNRSALPIPWLLVRDRYSYRLSPANLHHEIVSIPGKNETTVSYRLRGYYRGVYPVGPLELGSGDIFGIRSWELKDRVLHYVTVFPKIVPLAQLGIPSVQPFGSIRTGLPLFEDPSRKKGIRDYYHGDGFNRINWKASARTGALQVNHYEPTISMGTVVFLNLNLSEYTNPVVYYSELAIMVAASIANYIFTIGQEVGLVTNGYLPPARLDEFDAQEETPGEKAGAHPVSISSGKGYTQLIKILESLARVEARSTSPFMTLPRVERLNLSWGTTLIFITSDETEGLLPRLVEYQHSGYNIVLILLQSTYDRIDTLKKRCKEGNITLYHIRWESDMDVWKEEPRWMGRT